MGESDEQIITRRVEQEHEYNYDVVIVLGGGLSRNKDKFYPTNYRDSDNSGMLGGVMRVIAAVDLYLSGQSKNFMFSGVVDKKKFSFKDDAPSESSVYKEKFNKILNLFIKRGKYTQNMRQLENPEFVNEDNSNTTKSNIQEALNVIKKNDWKNVAIVSSEYHIPRIRALFESLEIPVLHGNRNITFLSAEDVVRKYQPGKYDDVIKKYYRSPEAKKREKNEQIGLERIESGEYRD